jgi:hypothetical protein
MSLLKQVNKGTHMNSMEQFYILRRKEPQPNLPTAEVARLLLYENFCNTAAYRRYWK